MKLGSSGWGKAVKKGLKFLGILAGIMLVLLITLSLALQTSWGQNILREQAVRYLERRLRTRIAIGQVNIKWLSELTLQDVVVEDRQQRKLLELGLLHINLRTLDLLEGKLSVRQIQVQDLAVRLYRKAGDSTYNFQFIPDAFASEAITKQAPASSGKPFQFDIGLVDLQRVSFLMQDGWSGINLNLHLDKFNLSPKSVDPAHMRFQLGSLRLDSATLALANFAGTAPADTSVSASIMPWLNADSIQLSRIDIRYADSTGAMRLHTHLGNLKLMALVANLPGKDLQASHVFLADQITEMHTRSGNPAASSAATPGKATTSAPYTFRVGRLELLENAFSYQDDAAKAGGKSFDANDLGLSKVNLLADGIAYDGKTYMASIASLKGRERSGLELRSFRSFASYADTAITLRGLALQTGQNELEGDIHLGYASLAALASAPGKAKVNVDLRRSRIRLDEILVFAPALSAQASFKPLLGRDFLVATRMQGTVADLELPSLQLTEKHNRISLTGRIRNLPDLNRLVFDLGLREASSTRSGLLSLLPKGLIADSLQHFIPSSFTVRGTANGTVQHLSANLRLASSLGDLAIKGSLDDITDKHKARYDLYTGFQNFHLGELMQDSTLGELTASVKAKGSGYDLMSMHAAVQSVVHDFRYKGYGYHDIGLDGSIEAGKIEAELLSQDPNLDLDGAYAFDMNQGKGSFYTDTRVRNIDLFRLGFSGDTLSFSGNLHVDLPVMDTSKLLGNGQLTSIRVTLGSKTLHLDSIMFEADHRTDSQYLALRSKLLDIEGTGQFNFLQIPEAARVIANRYIYTESSDTVYRHRVVARLVANLNVPDTLAHWIPGLVHVAPIQAKFNLNTDSATIGFNLLAPKVEYNGMVIDTTILVGTNLTRNRRFNKLLFALGTQGAYTASVHIPKTFLYGTVHRGLFDAKLSQFNEDMKTTRYNLPFVFTNDPARPNLHLGDSLQINGRIWNVNPDNQLYFGGGAMRDSHLDISRNHEQISFQTAQASPDGLPMSVEFHQFQLENITSIIRSDTSFLTGTANGRVVLESSTPLAFLADLTVDSLMLMGQAMGNLHAKARHTDLDHIAVDIGLLGHGNDLSLAGQLNMKDNHTDLRLDVRALDLAITEAFAKDYLADTKGKLKGAIDVKGSLSNPDFTGELRFDSSATTLRMLNMQLRLPEAGLILSKNGIGLDRFVILDSAGNTARLEGGIAQRNGLDFVADLKLVARNFRVIGPKRFKEQIASGPARADAAITLKGSLASIQMEGNAKLRDSSLVTYVYTSELGTSRGDGLIEFFDPAHVQDSTNKMAVHQKPAPQTSMNLFLTVTPSSTVNVVLDEMAGDALVVRGSTNLNINKRPGEMVGLTGTYTVDDGSYELTIAGLVRKKFRIQKNSTITWSGDVTKANMNIRALYETRTTAGALVNDIQSVPGIDKQKLGFKVYLLLTREILKPDIQFELDMDENDKAAFNGTVYNRIKQVNNIPAELNKQVMGLLAINSFIAENPFSSLSTGGSSFSTQAFNSVGGLLTQELNNLVGNLIKGVDISFALDVKEDYTSGSAARNTDLKMGVRKSFADNRLAVYVGSSLALENQNQNVNTLEGLAGDVTVEYLLTPDGKYRLKGYRINEQVMTFQGTIIKTGVTFVLQIEFGKFKNMFRQNPKD